MTSASSGSAHKSAPIPPNRSQRPPDRPREGKSKRTLIESACTACQKRKSRVSSSPFYSLLNANLVNIHMLTIFPSATDSGRYLVTKACVLSSLGPRTDPKFTDRYALVAEHYTQIVATMQKKARVDGQPFVGRYAR